MKRMAEENPYDPPKHAARPAAVSPVPLLWSMATVFVSAFVGGIMGTGIGVALGSLVPEYYRSVFPRGDDPTFDPVAVGIGQGLTQGVVFGGIVGLVIVALYYWYRLRSAVQSEAQN